MDICRQIFVSQISLCSISFPQPMGKKMVDDKKKEISRVESDSGKRWW